MTRRRLKAKDIERLENTSPVGDVVDACKTEWCPSLPDTNTCGCQTCILETDCCAILVPEFRATVG